MRHNQRLKTAGPQTAHLIAIYDRGQTTFTNSDVEAITGLEATSARSLVRNAEAGGRELSASLRGTVPRGALIALG